MLLSYMTHFAKAKLFTRSYNKNDEEPISGEVVIVTGANKGIGKAISLELARRGAIVVMACRDLSRGQAAVDEIKTLSGNENVVCVYSKCAFCFMMYEYLFNYLYTHCQILMKLDVSDMESVRAFANEVKLKYPKLKVLINNAAIHDGKNPHSQTPAGLNKTIATNYLGPFLLTNLLLDNLKNGAPSRYDFYKSYYIFRNMDVVLLI